MARVILEMDVHCTDCAKKIRKAVLNIYGVEKVSASPESGLVVVTGPADAEMLKSRIERKMGRRVTIVSHGGAAPEPVDAHRWAPRQQHGPRYGGGWGMPQRRYGAPHLGFPYAGNHWAPPPPPMAPRRWHASHGAPARHYDEDEGPQNCCSIQ